MYDILLKCKNILLDNIALYKKRIIVFACISLLMLLFGFAVGACLNNEDFTPLVSRIGEEKSVISVFFIRTLPAIAAIFLFVFTINNKNCYLIGLGLSAIIVICFGVELGRLISAFSFSSFITIIIVTIPFVISFAVLLFLSACLYDTYKNNIFVCGVDLQFAACLSIAISLINIIFFIVLLWIFALFF